MNNSSHPITQDKIASRGEALAKVAYTVPEAVLASGLSRSMLYVAMRCGDLRARKCGSRTVILDSELRRFLRNLPRLTKARAAPEAAA